MSEYKPTILEALLAAKEHLEYCGYGDSWERECAMQKDDKTGMNLPELIETALANAELNKLTQA